jgi:hypothetical protein
MEIFEAPHTQLCRTFSVILNHFKLLLLTDVHEPLHLAMYIMTGVHESSMSPLAVYAKKHRCLGRKHKPPLGMTSEPAVTVGRS